MIQWNFPIDRRNREPLLDSPQGRAFEFQGYSVTPLAPPHRRPSLLSPKIESRSLIAMTLCQRGEAPHTHGHRGRAR